MFWFYLDIFSLKMPDIFIEDVYASSLPLSGVAEILSKYMTKVSTRIVYSYAILLLKVCGVAETVVHARHLTFKIANLITEENVHPKNSPPPF